MGPIGELAAAPAAAAVDADLACPLCGYNLRGLTTPRCPECGYAFEWEELRKRQEGHPYLFEHAERRRARAFLLTLVHGLRPLKFWGSVRPTHEPRPRRVVVYWLLAVTAPVLLLLASLYVERAIRSARWMLERRATIMASLPPDLAADPGVPGQLKTSYPLPHRLSFHRRLWDGLDDDLVAFLVSWAIVYAAWPWLTVAALSVFRVSMRRARILPGHVLRCVVYSYDALAVLAPLMLVWAVVAGMSANVAAFTGGWTRLHDHDAMPWMAIGPLALLAIAMVRLMVAYRRYLRFHLPELVVLSAQVIVLLFVMAASFYIEEVFFD